MKKLVQKFNKDINKSSMIALLKLNLFKTQTINTISESNFHTKIYSRNIINNIKRNFSIFIKTGDTPNPHFLKFFPGKDIMEEGQTHDISSKKQALISPLATKLFDIKGVNRVFYGSNYISVGKDELVDWTELKPLIIDQIVKNFTENTDLFLEKPESEDTDIKEGDSEAVILIKEIIAARIRPVVQEDGGDLKFHAFDETNGIVYVEMKGSCSGCPSSGVTLKNGIEKMLIHYVAEVKAVEEWAEDEIN